MRVAITLPGEILPLPALLCNYGEALTTAKVEFLYRENLLKIEKVSTVLLLVSCG